MFYTFIGDSHLYLIIPDPDFNPKEAKKMEEALRKMEKKEKKTFKGTAKAIGLAAKLSPKAQRKKDLVLNSTAQLKVCFYYTWSQGFKTCFMHKPTEIEISTAYKN